MVCLAKDCVKVLANRYLPMGVFMKENGFKMKCMELEDLRKQTERKVMGCGFMVNSLAGNTRKTGKSLTLKCQTISVVSKEQQLECNISFQY